MSGDILVDIPDEDLPELAEFYKSQQNWAPLPYCLTRTGIKWKQNEKNRNFFTFMSPENCWRTDGTIIVLMEGHCYDIFVFTLQENCENLYNGLMNTKRINLNRRLLFFSIYDKHLDAVNKFITQKKLGPQIDIPCSQFLMPIEKSKQLTIDCPPDVYIKKLQVENAKQINDVWPHRSDGSDKYISLLIEMNGGFGLFLKSTNEMVAWIMRHCLGHLGMLQTEAAFKKKGYGGLLTKILAKELADEGIVPSGTVLEHNVASKNMFRKLEFDEVGFYSYVIVNDDKNLNGI